MVPPDVNGRVVLVTGASRGLGRALVLRLAAAGAHVAACARGLDTLASIESELPTGAPAPLFAAVDVADAPATESFVADIVTRWGRIDGLVNNASILDERVPLRDVDVDTWRQTIETNLTGAFIACRAVVPVMRAQADGSIVNVSSGVGDQPRASWGAYAVSKHALEGFSWNLALEERASGIRVNVVDPGRMRTGMRRAAYPEEDPHTLPDPMRVTDIFLWLLGAASAGTTGQRLRAQDGGR